MKIKKTIEGKAKNLFYRLLADIDCKYQKNGPSQITEKSKKIQIMTLYYKPFFILNNKICTPIHCGRAIQPKGANFRWMCKHMIGDDTGDNISKLNKSFSELTGIYWTWKNYDKIGNPDYIGFMSYRVPYVVRHYPDPYRSKNFLDRQGYNEKRLLALFEENKATFLSGPFFTLQCPVFAWCKTQEFWDIEAKFSQVIKNENPTEHEQWEDYIHQHEQGPYKQMFITSREEFFKFYNWLFPKLFQTINTTPTIKDSTRKFAYLAEVATSFYFYQLAKTCNHVELPTFQMFLS